MTSEKIVDEFGRAINDLFGLVPKADREQAIAYVRVLQQCKQMLAEATQAVRQAEVAAFHFNQSVARNAEAIARIQFGE